MKILVVEDNIVLNKSIVSILEKEGYTAFQALTTQTAKELFIKNQPDLVLLDVMLYSENGIELIPFFRQHYNVWIIMITALSDRQIKSQSYLAGADDFITKPIDLYELVYKLNAIRKREVLVQNNIKRGDIVVDLLNHSIKFNGKAFPLQPTQSLLFKLLYEKYQQNTYLEKHEIINYSSEDVDETTRIHTLVARLRKRLDEIGSKHVKIETIYGKGYELVIESSRGNDNE